MQYFAQDEATRLDPTLTVYQTLAGDAPIHMVPSIRNILGGFLFSGDDVDKPVRVLSGGERTRLAVARMLLRPANTLLLDEPTNHLDLDSKDVLLEALEDFGGTLIFVSHDRYFVDKLATKVIEIGGGEALDLPGQLRGVPLEPEAAGGRRRLLRSRSCEVRGNAGRCQRSTVAQSQRRSAGNGAAPAQGAIRRPRASGAAGQGLGAAVLRGTAPRRSRGRRVKKAADALRRARRGAGSTDRRPGAGDQGDRSHHVGAGVLRQPRTAAQPIIDKHQALMWEVGDLMNQWEALQTKS